VAIATPRGQESVAHDDLKDQVHRFAITDSAVSTLYCMAVQEFISNKSSLLTLLYSQMSCLTH
jgi:hypothetical protein